MIRGRVGNVKLSMLDKAKKLLGEVPPETAQSTCAMKLRDFAARLGLSQQDINNIMKVYNDMLSIRYFRQKMPAEVAAAAAYYYLRGTGIAYMERLSEEFLVTPPTIRYIVYTYECLKSGGTLTTCIRTSRSKSKKAKEETQSEIEMEETTHQQ